MNLILFSPDETEKPLPLGDPRAVHILEHLRREDGESFDAGLIHGPRGKGWIEKRLPKELRLRFTWEGSVPASEPVILAAGIPRPQTARRILREASALGVQSIRFFTADKGPASYRESRLWSTGEYRRHLIEGAQQAFTTRIPSVSLDAGLKACLDALPGSSVRVALDVYEGTGALSGISSGGPDAILAVGPERGWSRSERNLLRAAGFTLVHLGERVLRSDTACVSGLTLVLAKLGRL